MLISVDRCGPKRFFFVTFSLSTSKLPEKKRAIEESFNKNLRWTETTPELDGSGGWEARSEDEDRRKDFVSETDQGLERRRDNN